jgi:nucleotide-binding universal stress UspA family protein
MNSIAVLIDFTSISAKALEFAVSLALRANSALVLVHVAENEEEDLNAVNDRLQELHSSIPGSITVSNLVQSGAFLSVIKSLIGELNPDLVVVPTHGKVGLMQNLFGSNILKLLKTLSVPALVVQENSVLSEDSFKSILFPVGPHRHFDVKYKQTAAFAKAFGSTVFIYTVRNDIRGISEELLANIQNSKTYFDSVGVKCEEVAEEPTGFSVGYAKHILNYAKTHGLSMLSIMSLVSDDSGYMDNTEKENMILNKMALPVFSANH